MILVDTSVWVDHLRRGDSGLASALDAGQVLTHPFVLGELACGNLKRRAEILSLLRELPRGPTVTDDEAQQFIERRKLMDRGIGYIDVHLLASTVLAENTVLWTRDKRLASIADEMGLKFDRTQSRSVN